MFLIQLKELDRHVVFGALKSEDFNLSLLVYIGPVLYFYKFV